jgi:hypothetical protein
MRPLLNSLVTLTAVFALTGGMAAVAAPAGGPHASGPATQTLRVAVEGLNCALCGDGMRASLKKVTGARDLEPRLECGAIYLEVPFEKVSSLNEAGLTFTLLSNGFNFKGIQPVPESLSKVRADKETC